MLCPLLLVESTAGEDCAFVTAVVRGGSAAITVWPAKPDGHQIRTKNATMDNNNSTAVTQLILSLVNTYSITMSEFAEM